MNREHRPTKEFFHGNPFLFIFTVLIALFPPDALPKETEAGQKAELLRVEDLANLSIEELGQVQVTSLATGTRKIVPEAPSTTTVITSEDIKAMGATTFDDILETVPGFHVVNASQGFHPRYLLRGTFNRNLNPQVLFLFNGVPDSGIVRSERSSQLGVLPVNMIKRIEVIRGPGSALYGADAVAGVINIVTKTADDIKGDQAGALIGSFDTFQSWYQHGKSEGPWKFAALVDFRQTAGQKEEIKEDAQTRIDRLRGTQASLAPGPGYFGYNQFSALVDLKWYQWQLHVSHADRRHVGLGYGLSGSLDPNGRISRQRTIVDLTHVEPNVFQTWEVSNRISFHRFARESESPLMIFPPGADLGKGVFPNGVLGNLEYFERQFRFDNSAVSREMSNHIFNVGAGYAFHQLYEVRDATNFYPDLSPRPGFVRIDDTDEISLPETSRTNYYLYGQDEWYFAKDWEFIIGLRHDVYNDFSGSTNPRAALVWKVNPRYTSKFLYGTAFRAPSFGELYNKNNPSIIGNPNLKPEKSEVYEWGHIYQVNQTLTVSLNLFFYRIEDLIVYKRDPIGTATAQNASSQDGRGFELEAKYKILPSLNLTGNYSFIRLVEKESGESPGRYPNHQAYLRADWSFKPSWSLGTQFIYVGEQLREPQDSRPPLDGRLTTDLILRRSAKASGLSVSGIVRNLFDANIVEPSPVVAGATPGSPSLPSVPGDFPQARRSLTLEVSYHF